MGICCSTDSANEPIERTTADDNFNPLKRMVTINMAKDIKIVSSDFILENKGKFTDFYKLGGVLGEGAYGTVRKCAHNSCGQIRAVKIMSKADLSTTDALKLKQEIEILRNLDHPNIMKLYEIFEDHQKFYLVSELCAGGELFDFVLEKG